jgi:glycosyltransferase involved in cell wall biosynthesis
VTAPLTVLSLTNTPADPASGSGYVVLGYAAALRERGHAVRVLDPGDYEPLPRLHRAHQYKQAVGMALRAVREVRREPPDVLELWGAEAWLAALRLRRLGGRSTLVVARSNGLEPHCARYLEAARRTGELDRDRWYHFDQTRWFERTFRSVDALVTVSEFDRSFALERGYLAPERILALANPLPDSYLGIPVPPEDRDPVIGFCGSWIPRKGVRLLAEAIPSVLREQPAWRLLLVGCGELRPADHFPADVVDRIRVVPRADREADLVSLYRTMSLLVMPSIYESFGLVAAEAMACATPVLGPPTGLLASLEAGREYLALPDRTPEALIAALRRALLDPALRTAVGLAGRRRAQDLRWDGATDRLESAYRRWLTELRHGAGAADHT